MVRDPTTEKGRATLERILHATSRLVAERGVDQVSLEDVEREADVGRSQLYHYFDGRDDLLRAVIDTTTEGVLGDQAGLLDDLDSLGAIDTWFDGLVALQEQRGARGGCPIGSLVGQLAERDEQTRAALAASFDRWQEPLISGLKAMQDRGDLRSDVSAEWLADVTMATIQGGLLLTQVRRDPQQLRHALDGARAVLGEAIA